MRFSYVALFTCGLALAAAQSGDKPAPSLEKAIQTEMVDGDLKSAIEQYKAIAEGRDRGLAAKALVRLGECYEKLRDPQAKKVYERVVAQFADQPEAAQARTRLNAKAAVESPAVGAVSQLRMWSDLGGLGGMKGLTASPDGSFVVQMNKESNLRRHNLATGEDLLLTTDGDTPKRRNFSPEVSPDGRLIAYASMAADSTELRIVGADGSGQRVVMKGQDITPEAWSSDGTRILANHFGATPTNELALVSVADGAMTVVKSGSNLSATANAFSPDGRYIVYNRQEDPAKSSAVYIMSTGGSDQARLPSDGSGAMWTPDGRSIVYRSNRSGQPALWSQAIADGKPQGSPELISGITLFPMIFLQIMGDRSVFYTTVTRQTDVYAAQLDPAALRLTSAPERLDEHYVGAIGNLSADWSPDSRSIVYSSGGKLVTHSIGITEEQVVPDSAAATYGDFWFSSDGRAILAGVQRDSDGVRRIYLRRVDLRSGEVSTLLDMPAPSGFSGASQAGVGWNFSPDFKTLYYSGPVQSGDASGAKALRLVRRDLQTGEEKELVRLNSKMLGCFGVKVSPDGRQVTFSYRDAEDRFWLAVAPTEGGAARHLLQTGVGLLAWTKDSRNLLFQKSGVGLYTIPAAGGDARPFEAGMPRIGGISLSPDNTRIAFLSTQMSVDLWLYKNLLPPAPAQ